MSRYTSEAERRAFHSFEETCPSVDYIMEQAAQKIKDDVTQPFRHALIAAHQEVIDMEAERDEAQRLLERAEERIDELKAELDELQEKLNEATDGHIALREA